MKRHHGSALFLILLATIIPSRTTQAQEVDSTGPWKTDGNVTANFSQVGLSNWSAGGKNTIAMTALFGFNTLYQRDNGDWKTSFEIGYGVTKLEQEEIRKSDDHIVLVSRYGYKSTGNLLYSGLIDFRTQLFRGYDYDALDFNTGLPTLISKFMAPGYLSAGLGMSYKPSERFEFLFAPLSNRLVFVLDDSLSDVGAFGVIPGHKVKNELGILTNLQFQDEVMENVNVKARLNLFAPYDDLTTIIVNLETLFNFRVNEYISASVAGDLIYDAKVVITRDDGSVGPATQLRDVIAIGVGYTF